VGKVNLARMIGCGLLAGLIINISEFILNGVVLKNDWTTAMAALNKPPMSGKTIGIFVVGAFVFGILLTWIYAAIRPRFGPGPRTAIFAGLITWLIGYVNPSLSMWGMGLFPSKLIFFPLIWGLFEVLLATLAGAWLYAEQEAAAAVG